MRVALGGGRSVKSRPQPSLIHGPSGARDTVAAIPAPVEGWDAISALADMDPKRAIALDNFFPQPGYVQLRKGNINWATSVGTTSVESLMAYQGLTLAASKLFAASNSSFYDVTSQAAATVTTVTGLSNNRWQYVNYTTSAGTAYLWAVNGINTGKMYDGSSWSTPSVTGVTSDTFINVNVFKKRLWFIVKDSMNAAYLPLDSISGAATAFPLGSVMRRGGYLVAMTTWTRDGGSGADDFAVFISSMGEVAVFQGVDVASTFSLVGVYQLPAPIGYRCFTNVAGDVAVVTVAGVLPLSKALGQDVGAEAGIAITGRINNAINTYANSYKGNFGWELTPFPLGTMALLNVPVSENATAYQAVMNTLTGAWCRFIGWNFNTLCVFKDELYAGANNGTVRKLWTGSVDVSTQIDGFGKTAYNYFGKPAITKRIISVQPLITTNQSVTPAIGISTDFRDNAVVGTPTASSTASALYDSAIYDTDIYPIEDLTSADWVDCPNIGKCAAVHFRASANASGEIRINVNGFHVLHELGNIY